MPLPYHRITPATTTLVRRYNWWIAAAMMTLMFVIGITTMRSESAIVDEVAHIPSAYSYDHFGDYRLNPEHPPLIKNLAGLPLQFLNLKFPSDEPAWTTQVNGQWDTGWNFLYHLGNNAGEILFWARLPILLIGVGFGFLLYAYCKRHFGIAAGLLATFFYTLSPNIIAHMRYVTTDVGASATIFIALVTFVRFVRLPTRGNLVWLSLALALANLVKFNSVLLYPFMLVLALVAAKVNVGHSFRARLKQYVGGTFVASALSVVWIYLYYLPNTWNTTGAEQRALIAGSLTYGPGLQAASVLEWLSHVPGLKPLVQYFLGVVMVVGRVSGGNVTYFNGQVTNGSFHTYFLELFLVKTQVALLILMLLTTVIGLVIWRRGKAGRRVLWARFTTSLRQDYVLWVLGLFATFYFGVSVAGNLNLGIRHILPIYIPIFVVTAVGTVRLWRRLGRSRFKAASTWTLAGLMVWYGLSTILAYPSYTSYFNELIGGGANADEYFSDSGVDWGQDLIHLRSYLGDHHITTFALDYFGGAEVKYYFCNRAYDANGNLIATADGYDCSHSGMVPWHAQNGTYTGQYIAVSETYLENDLYYAKVNQQPGYGYLRSRTPIAKIGNSIYLYKLY